MGSNNKKKRDLFNYFLRLFKCREFWVPHIFSWLEFFHFVTFRNWFNPQNTESWIHIGLSYCSTDTSRMFSHSSLHCVYIQYMYNLIKISQSCLWFFIVDLFAAVIFFFLTLSFISFPFSSSTRPLTPSVGQTACPLLDSSSLPLTPDCF